MKSKSIAAIVVAALGTTLFTFLLVYHEIGSISYVTLLCALGLISLVLHGFSRIRELDLKNLKMTLDRIEEAKAEVFAKEADLKNITISLAQIIAFSNAFQGRLRSEESYELQSKWYRLQTNKLLNILAVNNLDRREILKYDTFFQKVKTLKSTEEKEKFSDELLDMMKEDIEKGNE